MHSETFTKEILGLVSSSVATVPCNGEVHILVVALLHKYFLESVAEIEEVSLLRQFALEEVGLHIEFMEGHAKFPLSLSAGSEGRLVSIVASKGIIFLNEGGGSLPHLGLGPEVNDGVASFVQSPPS